jgi:predicted porin
MKKSLLALAVLGAFASAASAQSSVTLSGMVDMGVRRVGTATGYDWNTGGSQSGYNNFTLSGREDLGGGMFAFFTLNHRFNLNNGTVNSQQNVCSSAAPTGGSLPSFCTPLTTFYRNTAVGLGGAFGDVRLGRILMPLQDMNGGFDPFLTGTVGSTHTGGITATIRANNAIYYRSPNLGGLTVHAAIAAGEGQPQGETANNFGQVAPLYLWSATGGQRPVGFSVRYAAGPLNVGLAYDRNFVDYKTTGVYGSYDFGAFKLTAQYEKGDSNIASASASALTKEDIKNFSIGATIPLGPVLIRTGYIRVDSDKNTCNNGLPSTTGAAGKACDARKFGFGGDYNLSKRTNLYATVGKSSGDRLTAAQKKAAFDLGVTHRF